MNKYEEKLMELTSKDATIYDLIQEEIQSPKIQILDFLLEGLLKGRKALMALKTGNSYYLVINKDKSELVQIERDLTVLHKDVTRAVQAAANKKSFEFEGKRYKLHRKIR
ncbi:hypothetical protein [Neobacillus sp. FSL H8-0543]|uniref:hypothetical protein n=1 Tax=Neobacillus sp. FSL H8-0543 TaxID=2954672 RepID=UPI00315815A6